MDRSNAKVLTLIPLFLLGVTLALMLLNLLIIVPIAILFGFLAIFDLAVGIMMIVIFGIVLLMVLFFMIFPVIALIIGYFKIYKPISNDEYSDQTKVFVLINIVICFLFGGGWFGWIAAILYIILLVSWDELAHPERRAYYYGPPPEEYPQGEKPRSKETSS